MINYSYLIQISSASISALASVVIVVMIKRATLSTPYRRLIFGLSAADIINSLGMVTGPLSSPKGLFSSRWGVGNVQICDVNGILNVFGSLGAALYLLALSIYFYLKLNRKMTDAEFTRVVEKKMHIFIIGFDLVVTLFALFTDSFNPIPTGAVCHFARYPPGCGVYPELVGECTRGSYSMFLIYLVNVGVIPLSLLGMSLCMIFLINYAINSERMFTLHPDTQAQQRTMVGKIFYCLFCWHREQDQREDESDPDFVLRYYRRETVTQAILYIVSFLLTNLLTIIIMIYNLAGIFQRSPAFKILTSLLYPSTGLFNILIYCRPKVQIFRLLFPEASWIRSFLLVVKAGGEVPNENADVHAFNVLCCCHPFERDNENQSPEEPASIRRNPGNYRGNPVSSRGNPASTRGNPASSRGNPAICDQTSALLIGLRSVSNN